MRRGSAVLLAVSCAVASVMLVACGSDPASSRPAAARAAQASTSSPTPTSRPGPTAPAFLGTGTALGYSCDELVGPATISQLGRGFTVNSNYQASSMTSAEQAVAIRGTACQWIDAKTGDSLIVTAAHPDPPTLSSITTKTRSYAKPTTMFGNDVTGFLVNTQVEIFTHDGFWATATSPLFTDLTKAKLIMDAVEESLPNR